MCPVMYVLLFLCDGDAGVRHVQREANGHNYYQVEFTAATSRYTRHQLAVIAVSNGKLLM